MDPDLWGHVRFGLDLLATRGLPSVDPYSFTQDVAWINHEWLSELLFAVAFRLAGVPGLVLLKVAILGLAAGVLAASAGRARESLRWWLLAAALFGLAPTAVTFRPQLWTVLCVALLCNLLVSGRSLKWVPLLFAVWANMHGGWIVGLGILGFWMVGRVFDTRDLRAAFPIALALAAALAATIVTPYGWRLWAFLFATVRMGRDITEWRPLWQQSDASHGILWAGTLAIVTATVLLRRRSILWAALLPAIWLGVSGLFVDRLAPLFSEVALLFTAHAWRPASAFDRHMPVPRGQSRTVLVDALILSLVVGFYTVRSSRCLPIEGAWTPDLDAASAFASPDVRGRLVLPFDWGQYAIWQWGPRLRVSIDGRRETVYSENTVNLQQAVATGEPEGLDYLGRVRPEYVWLPSQTARATESWLIRNGYRLDVRTNMSFVASRADLPPLAQGPPASRCFP